MQLSKVEQGGSLCKYILIPHDKVTKNSSFKGVIAGNILT